MVARRESEKTWSRHLPKFTGMCSTHPHPQSGRKPLTPPHALPLFLDDQEISGVVVGAELWQQCTQ
eukprot:12926031-Prorocentrum_lima.AAC.1